MTRACPKPQQFSFWCKDLTGFGYFCHSDGYFVEAFGAERVLFGSGSPYFDQCYEIKRILLAKVDQTTREAMRVGNVQRLLGLAD